MFTANGERLTPNDPHKAHQIEGGKFLLASLARPFLSKTPRFDSIREVLVATAAGHITAEQAQKAIERIQLRRRACTLTGPFELTAEGLQASCIRMENACIGIERAMDAFCRRMEKAMDAMEKKLNDHH